MDTITEPSKVYFCDLRSHGRESQVDKLKRLIRRAGIDQIDFENKFVAIKIHFGELGKPPGCACTEMRVATKTPSST